MAARNTTSDVPAGWPYEPHGPAAPTREELQSRPQACKLGLADVKERIEEIRSDFVPKIVEVEEIADGYVYWFERSVEQLRDISEFAFFESECCDFLDFGIGLNTRGDRISLRVSGPHGAANFLELAMKGEVPSVDCC